MTPQDVRALLERLSSGQLSVEQAYERLRSLPYRDVGVATVDHHRALRQGFPEAVFGEGKSTEQLLEITDEMVGAGHHVLITRVSPDKAESLRARHPSLRYAAVARVARIEGSAVPPRPCAPVAVVCAGTSDLPVAEEAVETLSAVGLPWTRIFDVGVAGLHRLLGRSDELVGCSAAIVVAGMEGALPSVVGGLIAAPVVAVPTSVGYGTAFGGLTALMGMLTSCAAGLTVVNIDNGFGAAMAAHRMLPRANGLAPT